MIAREDFIVWENDAVTKAFKRTIMFQIDGLKEELAQMAGRDTWDSGTRVGAIRALRDVLSYHMDDLEDSENA